MNSRNELWSSLHPGNVNEVKINQFQYPISTHHLGRVQFSQPVVQQIWRIYLLIIVIWGEEVIGLHWWYSLDRSWCSGDTGCQTVSEPPRMFTSLVSLLMKCIAKYDKPWQNDLSVILIKFVQKSEISDLADHRKLFVNIWDWEMWDVSDGDYRPNNLPQQTGPSFPW